MPRPAVIWGRIVQVVCQPALPAFRRLHTKPVSIKMTETKGGVKLLGGSVALDYLEIGVFRPVFPAFRQKSGADLPGKPLTAVLFFYMDCINSDVIAVQNTKSCGDDLSLLLDEGADRFLGNGPVHGGDYCAVNDAGGSLQIKKTVDPGVGYGGREGHIRIGCSQLGVGKTDRHNICCVRDLLPSVFQSIFKVRKSQGADLEDRRSSKPLVFLFTVGDFFSPGKGGDAELLYAVGPVGVKIGETQDPAVVKFHFVRRPCGQRHVFDLLDICFHAVLSSVCEMLCSAGAEQKNFCTLLYRKTQRDAIKYWLSGIVGSSRRDLTNESSGHSSLGLL